MVSVIWYQGGESLLIWRIEPLLMTLFPFITTLTFPIHLIRIRTLAQTQILISTLDCWIWVTQRILFIWTMVIIQPLILSPTFSHHWQLHHMVSSYALCAPCKEQIRIYLWFNTKTQQSWWSFAWTLGTMQRRGHLGDLEFHQSLHQIQHCFCWRCLWDMVRLAISIFSS